MENQTAPFQALFLIDTYLNNNSHSDFISKYSHSVALSVFRILKTLHVYGVNQTSPQTTSPLSWCYKFYNSNSDKARLRKACLTDFKLRHFEEFESRLQEKLESENQNQNVTRSSHCGVTNNRVITNNLKVKCHAEHLKDALTEVVTDITWEADLFSPIKSRRNSKQTQSNMQNIQKQQNNLVFLFSPIPHDKSSLRKFAGKRVIDSDVLVDSFMTPSLHTKFLEHAHLALIWVDTTCLHGIHQSNSNNLDAESMKIVESSIAALNGTIFSVDSIVSTSGRWLCGRFKSDSSEDQASVTGGVNRISLASMLPTTSLLRAVVQPTSRNQCQMIQANLSLCLTDYDKSVEVFLELIPATTNKLIQRLGQDTSDCNEGQHSQKHGFFNKIIPVTIETAPVVVTGNSYRSLSVEVLKQPNEDSSISRSLSNPSFSVVACINKMSVSQLMQSSRSYIAYSSSIQDTNSESVVLRDLLREMSTLGQILVVQAKDNNVVLPGLAVLDVHTSDSAVISFLSVGSSLQVEKAMFKSSTKASCDKERTPSFDNKDPTTLKTGHELTASSSEGRVFTGFTSDHRGMRSPCMTGIKRTKRIRRHHEQMKNKCSLLASNRPKSSYVSAASYNPQVLNPWHMTGGSKGLISVIGKLTERIDQLHFLTSSEKQILKSVQQMYRKQNRPAVLQKAKITSSVTEDCKLSEPNPSTDAGLKKPTLSKQKSGLFRGQLMVKRSRAVIKKSEDLSNRTGDDCDAGADKDKLRYLVDIPKMEFESEDDLGDYVKGVYGKLVENSGGLETGVQTMVTVSLHFMKHADKPDPEKCCADLLARYVLLSAATLREKYQNKTSNEDKSSKITEFQLQILLRLEMESAILHTDSVLVDQCVQQIVALLRALSFVTDSGFISAFLNKDLVTSYSSTLPKLLVSIYDELMQPLPDTLAAFGSPESSLNLSVLDRSGASHTDDSLLSVSQPPSEKTDILQSQSSRKLRSRKLSQHPSIDYGSKKQIVVMKTAAVKKEKKAVHNKSCQLTTRSRKEKEKLKQKSDVVKVRRNLFDGENPKLERRQSVAVMERVRKTPKKKLSMLFKSPQSSKSPRLRKKVAETPAHKQLSHSIWHKQDIARRKSNSPGDVEVVSESPLKNSPGNFSKYSPARSKHAVNMLRRSFYSAQPRNRSRNLTKYLELAHKIGGSHRLSLGSQPVHDSSGELTSPDNSTYLFSQLLGSPSPQGKSARKTLSAKSKHSVEDSPFKNTRSKTPTKTTRMLSFDSPLNVKRNHFGNLNHSLEQTPRKGSPRKPFSGQGLLGSLKSASSDLKLVSSQDTDVTVYCELDVSPLKPMRKASTPMEISPCEMSHTTPQKDCNRGFNKIVPTRLLGEENPAQQPMSDGTVSSSPSRITRSAVQLDSHLTPRKHSPSPTRSVCSVNSRRTPQRHSPSLSASVDSHQTPQRCLRSPTKSVYSTNSLGTPHRHSVGSFFKRLDSHHECSDQSNCAHSSSPTPDTPSRSNRQQTSSAWSSLQSTPKRAAKSTAMSIISPTTPSRTPKSCLASPRVKSPFLISPEKRVHFGKPDVSSLVDSHSGRKDFVNKLSFQEQSCDVSSVSSKNKVILQTPDSNSDASNLRQDINSDASNLRPDTNSDDSNLRQDTNSDASVLRTPSPCRKTTVKTPDSLDKWPRKKKRWVSPLGKNTEKSFPTGQAVQKEKSGSSHRKSLQANQSDGFIPLLDLSTVSVNDESDSGRSEKNSVSRPNKRFHLNEKPDDRLARNSVSRPMELFSVLDKSGDGLGKNVVSRPKKRALASSPAASNKRQRISVADATSSTWNSNRSHFCVQSHIISDTSIEDSEDNLEADALLYSTSIADYFSSMSDEVFLSDSNLNLNSTRRHNDFHTLAQDIKNINCEESDSPIFGKSPHRRLSRSHAKAEISTSSSFSCGAEKETSRPSFVSELSQGFECSEKSPQFDRSDDDGTILSSPKFTRKQKSLMDKSDKSCLPSAEISPQQVKFSPSVSAKSLIHLMHSPLIESPHSNSSTTESDCLQSPTRRHRDVTKSRKMLNLQN